MPKLSELEARPLAKAKCAVNLQFGTPEDVSRLFNFTTDQVPDYMISSIVGHQNALLVEKHEMRLLDGVDRLALFAFPRHRHREDSESRTT